MQASYRELIALDGREGGAHFISSSTFGRIVLEAKQPPGNALLSSFLSSPCFCLSTAICLRCLLQARPRSPYVCSDLSVLFLLLSFKPKSSSMPENTLTLSVTVQFTSRLAQQLKSVVWLVSHQLESLNQFGHHGAETEK